MAPTFVLILAIIFAEGQPPALAMQPQANLEQCLGSVAKFLAQDPKEFGAEGLSAACKMTTTKEPGDPA